MSEICTTAGFEDLSDYFTYSDQKEHHFLR